MTKKPRSTLEEKMMEDAGKGVSTELIHRAFWLDPEYHSPWIAAFEAIDKKGDKEPLLTLLRSDARLIGTDRVYLADLLTRYELKKRRGRPRTPAYDRTDIDIKLLQAEDRYRSLRARGVGSEEAANRAADEFGINRQAFANHLAGKRGSSRRLRNSRP